MPFDLVAAARIRMYSPVAIWRRVVFFLYTHLASLRRDFSPGGMCASALINQCGLPIANSYDAACVPSRQISDPI
jgi:hypothetical protein